MPPSSISVGPMHMRYLGVLLALVLLMLGRSTPTPSAETPAQAPVPAPSSAAASASENTGLPRFEDYATTDTFRGSAAPVRIESARYGRMFRTRLRAGARGGPNFAGAFAVVQWGCGSSCQIVSIVDARRGLLSAKTVTVFRSPASAAVVVAPIVGRAGARPAGFHSVPPVTGLTVQQALGPHWNLVVVTVSPAEVRQ